MKLTVLLVKPPRNAYLLNHIFTSQSRINDAGIHPPEPQIRTQSILDNIVVEVDEVHKVISELKTYKANGPDRISNKSIKTLSEIIAEPLNTDFLNNYLRNGVFPTKWNSANVIPIFKKGDN
jgi:hypothetical protein